MITLFATALLGLGFGDGSASPTAALPMCQFEDGNTDGLPCTWIDPGTGVRFYVTSENYR